MDIRVDARSVELPTRSIRSLAARVARQLSRLKTRIARIHITLKDVKRRRDGLRSGLNAAVSRVALEGGHASYAH